MDKVYGCPRCQRVIQKHQEVLFDYYALLYRHVLRSMGFWDRLMAFRGGRVLIFRDGSWVIVYDETIQTESQLASFYAKGDWRFLLFKTCGKCGDDVYVTDAT